jgi:nucleotide-binding universal stress UspA family protein
MFKHILIPTDGSALSRKAVDKGLKLAKSVGARVTGVFAGPSATPIIYGDMYPVGYVDPRDHERAIKDAGRRYLKVIQDAAKKARVSCDVVQVSSDFPADAILATAKKKRCDAIVMATHGRRGVKGILLGSETQKVLTRATIPVMVVR